MTFGKDRKTGYQATNQEEQRAGYHECHIDMIKMHFVGGLWPSIRQVVESRYASITDKVMLLNAAKEAEIGVPILIVLDRGKEFLNETMKKLCEWDVVMHLVVL